MSAKEFYDNYVTYQVESGINDRIYSLYKRLSKIGIPSNINVLEIGCGIGRITYLLSKKIKTGSIEAMDLSPKSIEYAQKHLKQHNLSFYASDIFDFSPKNKPYDWILLFDVLEHIPAETHDDLFLKLSSWMKEGSQIIINLPNADYTLYDQKNNPDALQEIDQPIYIEQLISSFAKASLALDYFETYSVWVQNDYHFIVVKKKEPFTEKSLNQERNLFDKIALRINRVLRKVKYNFPK